MKDKLKLENIILQSYLNRTDRGNFIFGNIRGYPNNYFRYEFAKLFQITT